MGYEIGSGAVPLSPDGSSYPNDTLTTQSWADKGGAINDSNTRVDAALINDIARTLIHLIDEIGITPSGSYSTVKQRLDTYLPTTGAAFTAGSIAFSNGTSFAQDNTNLFWDDSLNILRTSRLFVNTSDATGTAAGYIKATRIVAANDTAGGLRAMNAAASDTIALAYVDTSDRQVYGNSGPLVLSGTNIFVGDVSNTFMSQGLTINQGANDNEILTLKSSDVAHGITSITESDTFFVLQKQSATEGGVLVRGFSEAVRAIVYDAIATTEDTTKSSAALGYHNFFAQLKSGTTLTGPNSTSNICVIATSSGVARFIFQADGESYQDVGTAWINFDKHEDWQIARAIRASIVPDKHTLALQHATLVKEYKPLLQQTGIITYNDDGHHFIAMRKLALFTLDGLFQTGEKVFVDHEQRLGQHEQTLQQLQQKIMSLESGKG